MSKQKVKEIYNKSIDDLALDAMRSIEEMEGAFNEGENEKIVVAFNHMQETLRHLKGNPE